MSKKILYSMTMKQQAVMNGKLIEQDIVQYMVSSDVHLNNPIMAFNVNDRHQGVVYKAITSKDDLEKEITVLDFDTNLPRKIKLKDTIV